MFGLNVFLGDANRALPVNGRLNIATRHYLVLAFSNLTSFDRAQDDNTQNLAIVAISDYFAIVDLFSSLPTMIFLSTRHKLFPPIPHYTAHAQSPLATQSDYTYIQRV
jgi:hypothetical protein